MVLRVGPMAKPVSHSLLLDHLCRSWPVPLWRDHRQLVAVSGGADSVALLRALVELAPDRNRLIVAHFNHGWRGAESDQDSRFVQDLCSSLAIEFRLGKAQLEDTAVAYPARTEESARRQRYEFLTQCAYEAGARYVLTAHTASDRVETLLHNLFRGTGLAGVTKPALLRPLAEELVLVRPLISCFRDEIEEFLTQRNQPFCQDSSNQDQTFRRNFLRQSLLPMLRERYGPAVDERILSFSQTVEETAGTLDQLANQYWNKVENLSGLNAGSADPGDGKNQRICLPSLAALQESWPVVRHALQIRWDSHGWPRKALSRSHWEQIRQFWLQNSQHHQWESQTEFEPRPAVPPVADSDSQPIRPQMLPGSVRISLVDGWVLLERQQETSHQD